MSYRGCSHAKGELQKRKAQRAPKGSSKLTLPAQSYEAALLEGIQHQQQQAPQRDGKSALRPVQQHLSQQKFQKKCLSVWAPSPSDNYTLKVATVVRQIMTELSQAVSGEDKIIVITK
jgi:hypothetical protein